MVFLVFLILCGINPIKLEWLITIMFLLIVSILKKNYRTYVQRIVADIQKNYTDRVMIMQVRVSELYIRFDIIKQKILEMFDEARLF